MQNATHPKRRPTPNKRCESVEEKITVAIREGMTIDCAVLSHGIHPVTFLRWRRCENPNSDSTERDDRCWNCRGCSLQKKMDYALETYKSVLLKRIANATNSDGEPIWQASAWILERRFREEFSLRTVVDNHHVVNAGDENARRLVDAIIGKAAGADRKAVHSVP